MKVLIPLAIFFFLAVAVTGPKHAAGEPRHNPATGQWENARRGSQLRYNPVTEQWQYAPRRSVPTFNPLKNKWELAPRNARPTHDPFEKKGTPSK
jgi:hypothetical protein